MRWIVDRTVRAGAARGIEWARRFLAGFDTSRVEWVRLDQGRGRYSGVYGRCWYPTHKRRSYRISCQVPGPFPATIHTWRPPRYLDAPRELAPDEFVVGAARDGRTGRAWEQIQARTVVENMDEAVVWILAHEAYHFLRRSRQVPGRNGEAEADRFADAQLHAFRSARDPGADP
jgi:hypothetical protein